MNFIILAPPGPPRTPTDGTPQDTPEGVEGAVIRIYVYLQLQGPGSRLGTPNGAFKIGPKAYH